MTIPVELGEDWRSLCVGAYGVPECEYAEESVNLTSMVKGAALLVAHLPLDKLSSTSVTTSNIWRHVSAHPYALALLLVNRYSEDCLNWHPELLQTRMSRDKLAPSNAAWTKILAVRTLFTSRQPWRDWQTFHWVSLGLSGKSPNFGLLEEPEISNILKTVEVMRAVSPDRPFSEEVRKFIAASFRNESLIYAPYPVEFCQDDLDDKKLQCMNCDATHRDDEDRVCVTCGKGPLEEVPHPMQTELDEIRDLWKGVKDLPLERSVDLLPDTYPGNSVYRLAVYEHDTLDSKKSLASQLLLLGET